MAIEGGIMDIAYTLDEATSSNDILFMERASSGVIARNIAAGDFRSAFGARWYTDVFWAGGYVTGPTTGAIHSASSVNPPGTTEQVGAVARVAGQIVSGNGLFAASRRRRRMADPAAAQSGGGRTNADAERPSRIAHRSDHADLDRRARQRFRRAGLQRRGAGRMGPLFFQGEYFWFNVDRNAITGYRLFGAPTEVRGRLCAGQPTR